MNIGGISQSAVRRLVPISEYKGAILKLTEKDKKEIGKLQKKLVALEIEHYDMQKYINSVKHVSDNFWQKFYGIAQWIESLKAQIKDIKMNRLGIQNAKLQASV